MNGATRAMASGLGVRGLTVPGLAPVDLDVGVGECVCLSGASGSGKSRLLRALADLDPVAGEVALAGQSRERFGGPEWRRRVMLVPAESHWWADRVAAHFPQRPDGEALAALGLEEALLDRAPGDVSSGERQRLGLLRAVVRHPLVLLLDEPTASLDAESVALVERWLLARRSAGVGLLWVSHDAEQISRVADRCLTISQGRVT